MPAKRRKTKKKRKGNARALNTKLRCDQALYEIIGTRQATRAQIVKKIWDYVKKHRLQDPRNGRFIIPDRRLSRVMGQRGRRLHGFKIGRYIKQHAR